MNAWNTATDTCMPESYVRTGKVGSSTVTISPGDNFYCTESTLSNLLVVLERTNFKDSKFSFHIQKPFEVLRQFSRAYFKRQTILIFKSWADSCSFKGWDVYSVINRDYEAAQIKPLFSLEWKMLTSLYLASKIPFTQKTA